MRSARFEAAAMLAASLGAVAGVLAIAWKLRRPERPEGNGPIPPAPLGLPDAKIHTGLGVAAAVLVAALAIATTEAFRDQEARIAWAVRLTGGEPHNAPRLMTRHGCAGCHDIPGVPGASGTVGPPLRDIADRAYLGGVLRNTPENLVRWIRHSRDADPRTAMPNTDAPEQDARDIAAYLYSLPSNG